MDDGGRAVQKIVITAVLLVTGVYLIATDPEPERGKSAASSSGITDPVLIDSGYFTFRCSQGDTSYFRIKGKNAQGLPVTATVCCGIFKDCTVRY